MNLPYRKTCQVACALYAYTLRVVDSCRLCRKTRQWQICPFGGTPENPNRHPLGLGFAVVALGPLEVFPDAHRSRPLRCGVSPHGLRQIFYETFLGQSPHAPFRSQSTTYLFAKSQHALDQIFRQIFIDAVVTAAHGRIYRHAGER